MGDQELTWQRLWTVSSAELYAVTDADRVRRIGGVFWVWGSVIAAVMLPFAPPDGSSLGEAGWAVAVAIILAAAGYGLLVLRGSPWFRPGWRVILAFGYVGIVMTTILNWLAGTGAPYEELLLIGALFVAASFPPRVLAIYMVAVGFGLLVPLAWDGDVIAIGQVSRILIWTGLGMAVSVLLARQRLDQAALIERGEQARLQARADPLTGLGNRRAFDEAFEIAGRRAARTERAVSVIVADVEEFKAINDGHGLIAGDRLLREVATAIERVVRAPDACFRWGGDEFVILADVDGMDAVAFADRLGQAIEDACSRPDGRPVRLHIGVAELDPESGNPADALNAASRAMKPAPRLRG